jgi:hypothetical protein
VVTGSARRGAAWRKSTYNEEYPRCRLKDDVGTFVVIVASGWSFVVRRSLFLFHGVGSSRGLFTSPGGMIPMHEISVYHRYSTAQQKSPFLILELRFSVDRAWRSDRSSSRGCSVQKYGDTSTVLLLLLCHLLDVYAPRQGAHPNLSRSQQQQQQHQQQRRRQ